MMVSFIDAPCLVLAIVLVLAVAIFIISRRRKTRKSPPPAPDSAFRKDQEALRRIMLSQSSIAAARKGAAKNVDMFFLQTQESLAATSRQLEVELQSAVLSKLEASRFHCYTNLHFRSMRAADERYRSYINAKTALSEIGECLVSIGKGELKVSQMEKAQLYELKDIAKACKDAHYANVVLLNAQTHTFKEKIRKECGQRGEDWYARISQNTK